MDLINSVLNDPMRTGVLTVGGVAVSHFLFAADLLVTGGVACLGGYLVYRAFNKKS